jgi:transglutaminase-like putative cysteine protease
MNQVWLRLRWVAICTFLVLALHAEEALSDETPSEGGCSLSGPALMGRNTPDIRNRYVPPVAGVDLEQALNYVDGEGIDLAWFYRSFTYPRVFYKPGSRPKLEAVVWEHTKPDAPEMERLRALVQVVFQRMPHYIFLGYTGRPDRGLSEEQLLESGHGWCNEQARVLVALTQVAGLPSRLVFAHSRDGKMAHVVTEVYVEGKWVLVDQTEGYIFTTRDGRPLNVLDFHSDPEIWREADALYKARQQENRRVAKNPAFWENHHGLAKPEHPLKLFECVGYHNYFIH